MRLFSAIAHGVLAVGLIVGTGCNGGDDDDPKATCSDGLANGAETDVDCGGNACGPCGRDMACAVDTDCIDILTCTNNRCAYPTCDDGAQNQGETDVDCGGPNCRACPLGQGCTEDSDCLAGACTGGTCATTGSPMSESTLCAMYYFSGNAQDNMCMQRPVGSGQDYTAESLEWGCRPGVDGWRWAESLLAAASESRITIDWTAAEQCLSDARLFRYTHPGYVLANNGEWDNIANVTCKTFYSGNVGDGQDCKEDWDCGEGRGCYSDDPGTPGSAKCMAPAGENDPCDIEFHPCGKSLRCDDEASGTCLPKLANGKACNSDDECQSDWCYDTCTDSPYSQPGESCESTTDCVGDCIVCRPSEPGDPSICRTMGAEGDFCRDWNDCLTDLGCVNNECGVVEENGYCGNLNQGVCGSGLSCVPPLNCLAFDGDEPGCLENDEFCTYDPYYGYCDPVAGFCNRLPGIGNPCMYDVYCGAGYCDSETTICTAPAGAGEACNDSDASQPYRPCNENGGFQCLSGVCGRLCEYREDCPDGQYCWSPEEGQPQCMPINELECYGAEGCPNGKFCDVPGTHCFKHEGNDVGCNADIECAFDHGTGRCLADGGCDYYSTSDGCEMDPLCQWGATGSCSYTDCTEFDQVECSGVAVCWWDSAADSGSGACLPGCARYDNDEASCTSGRACIFNPSTGRCDSACSDFDNDQDGCEAAGTGDECLYTPLGTDGCFSEPNACRTLHGDFVGCRDHTDYPCSYTGAGCEPADPYASGACLPKFGVGEACIPDYIDPADPIPSDDATMCESGYSVQQGATELDYVCSVRPTNPVNGCTFVNETTAALLNTVFAFGGFFVWGRRARRRKIS